MSERLVFELLAVDRATAPLKAVQTQLDNTTAATKRLGNQTAGTTKDFRKFALGGLQQAGFQIGDFFVQVANGTNKMQAFGQQAPQLLQIFGPIGSVVGAAIAVFAAFSVIAEKSASATKASADRYADALDKLSAATKNAKDAIEQFRFGDSVASFTENEIKNLESQASRLRQILTELRTTETSGSSTGLEQITAMLARRSAVAEFQTRKEELRVVQEKLQVLRALDEAQRMLNGGLSVASGIQKGLVYDKQVELRNARELVQSYVSQIEVMGRTKAEAEAIAEAASKAGVSANDLAHINFSNIATAATEALRLAGNLGISLDAAARLAALGPQGIGGNDPSGGTYGGRGAGPSQADIIAMRVAGQFGYNTPPDNKKGGGGATDPIKRLREQLALETELLGKTEAQQRVIQALGLDYQKYGDTALNGLVEQITKMDQLNKLAEQQKEIASTVKSAFSGAFMSMVDGTKSVKDAFKDMARSIILKLYEIYVVEQLVNSITGAFAKAFPSAGKTLGFMADGGTMQANRPYIVGERGPELMVPGRSGAIIPNDKLGGGGVTVVQNINISTGVQQTVRSEIRSLMPQIAESAKAAVFDAQRRSVNGMGFA